MTQIYTYSGIAEMRLRNYIVEWGRKGCAIMNPDSQDSQVYKFVYAASVVLTFTGNSVEFTWMKSEEISPQAPIPQD